MIRSRIKQPVVKVFLLSIVLFFSTYCSGQNVTVAGANPATPNGTYATLGAAFTAINGQLQNALNITITITGNTTELATASLNQSAGLWNSLTIIPSGARTITGALANPLITLNGADKVKIDGLNSGGNSLLITNTSTSNLAATIKFVNDATQDTVTNCSLQGSSSGINSGATDGAIIWFSTASTGSGNDNNAITNCDLGPAGATLPYLAIKGLGTASPKDNSGIYINNNTIHDFFSPASSSNNSCGVYVNTGNTTWTISNNKLFQTATRSFTASGTAALANTYSCIQIQSGTGYIVSGNTCGFANAAGTGYTTINGSALDHSCTIQPIIINTTNTPVSVVSGNTVAGFDITSSRSKSTQGDNIFIGIYVISGPTNVLNNVIGATTGTNSIVIRATNPLSSFVVPACCIYVGGNVGSQLVQYNTIGAINLSFQAPGVVGTGDRIGLICINMNSGVSAGAITVYSNTIGNATAGNITSSHSLASIVGIQNNSAFSPVTIQLNTIRNIVHTKGSTGVNSAASVVGILDKATSGSMSILLSQNILYNLSNSNATGAIQVRGIHCESGASNISTVEKNWIYNLSIASTSAGCVITGISPRNTNQCNLYNNMISLGSGLSNDLTINGIEHQAGAVFGYFNSVRILGSASGSSYSYAYNYATSSTALMLKNNIFYNERFGGTGKNYSIRMQGSSSPVYSATQGTNNLLYTLGAPLANYGGVDCANLTVWNANCGGGDPLTSSKSSPVVFTSATDLHTSDLVVRNAGISLSPTVTDDIDLFLRPNCVDIGADEYDAGSIPGTAYTWIGTVDNKWCTACNWDRETVPPSGADVVIADDRPHYPLLQSGVGCGNVTVNNFTVQSNATPAKSAQVDLANYTLAVTGAVSINGTCSCTGVSSATPITEGLIDITSTTQQQILDIRNASGAFPGQICKLRINKTQPTGAASNRHEAILKGNLNILYALDFSNGVLLSQNGATYDADENTGVNFKTINMFNESPGAVTRQNIAAQNTRNGFFEGRLNRRITDVGTNNEYLFPLGYRSSGGTGVLANYFYCPSLVSFANATVNQYLVGTYLNKNTNFVVDGVNIGTTGHACGDPFEIDDQGGPTASTCLNHEIDIMGEYYWDFQENTGADALGNPSISPGALGGVNFDIECAGDMFSLQAMDGLTGSELRLVNRPSLAIPDTTGQGAWVTTAGTHNGANLSLNTGIAMYSITAANLQGARRDGLTSFSEFAGAGNGPSPLPVELLFFTAEKYESTKVLCTWATSTEINNDYFEVYAVRERNGVVVDEKIGHVQGNGTTSERHDYSLLDERPAPGKNYYHLKQVDYDGKVRESDMVVVFFSSEKEFDLIAVSPNPFVADPVVYLQSKIPGDLSVLVLNSIGQVIYEDRENLGKGSRTMRLPLSRELAAGIYYVRFLFNGEQYMCKLVKK